MPYMAQYNNATNEYGLCLRIHIHNAAHKYGIHIPNPSIHIHIYKMAFTIKENGIHKNQGIA